MFVIILCPVTDIPHYVVFLLSVKHWIGSICFFFSYSALGFSGVGEEEEVAAEEASEEEATAAAGEAETIEEAVAEAVAEVAEEVAEVAEGVAEAAQEVETAAEEVAAVAEAVEEAAQAVAEPPAPAVEEPENNGMTSPSEEEAAASEAWGSTHSPQGNT